MDSNIFEHWFHQWFVPSKKQHLHRQSLPCKAVLLIDNCAAHLDKDLLCSHDGQIKTVFLPLNTAAVLQPLDGGILETVKRNYQKHLLQHVITDAEGENSPSLLQSIKSMTIKDAVYMTAEAWEDLKAESVSKVRCKTLFNRVNQLSGAVASSERDVSSDDDACGEPEREPEDAAVISEQLREAGFSAVNREDIQEWLTADRNEPGHTTLTEDQILETVTIPDGEDDEEDDDNIADEPPIPSHSKAYTSLSTSI